MNYNAYNKHCKRCQGTMLTYTDTSVVCEDCGYSEPLQVFNDRSDQESGNLNTLIKSILKKYEKVNAKYEKSVEKDAKTITQAEYDALALELESCKKELQEQKEIVASQMQTISKSSDEYKNLESSYNSLALKCNEIEKKNTELESRVLNEASRIPDKPISFLLDFFKNATTSEERGKVIAPIAAILRNHIEKLFINNGHIPHNGRNYVCDNELYKLVMGSDNTWDVKMLFNSSNKNAAYNQALSLINTYIANKYSEHSIEESEPNIYEMPPIVRFVAYGIPRNQAGYLNKFNNILNNSIHAGLNGATIRAELCNMNTPSEDTKLFKGIKALKNAGMYNEEDL